MDYCAVDDVFYEGSDFSLSTESDKKRLERRFVDLGKPDRGEETVHDDRGRNEIKLITDRPTFLTKTKTHTTYSTTDLREG